MPHVAEFASNLPEQLNDLPCAKHAWADATKVIETAQSSIHRMGSSHNFVELEVRFGKSGSTFCPGVTEEAFRNLEARLDSGREWHRTVDWHNITSYIHPSAIRGDTRKLRTEITYPPGCDAEQPPPIECTNKVRITKHDYHTVPLGGVDQKSVDMRWALSVEHGVIEDVPVTTEPTAVHLKVRKCYYYAPTRCNQPAWCYALTMRWTASTLLDALVRKKTSPPVYEVELECCFPEYLLQKDPGKLSVKMLSKTCDILQILDPVHLPDPTSYIIEPTSGSMLWMRSAYQ